MLKMASQVPQPLFNVEAERLGRLGQHGMTNGTIAKSFDAAMLTKVSICRLPSRSSPWWRWPRNGVWCTAGTLGAMSSPKEAVFLNVKSSPKPSCNVAMLQNRLEVLTRDTLPRSVDAGSRAEVGMEELGQTGWGRVLRKSRNSDLGFSRCISHEKSFNKGSNHVRA
jgi:hypothetical protein